jgi:hypothetical protein
MKFSHSKNLGTIASAASLCLGLALSSPALAAASAGGSDRGGGDLRKLDASTIEMLLQGEQLKSAMLNYLNSIKLDQVADAQVKNTLSRISIAALRTDILTRDNYKSGSQCQDSYNQNVPASAKIGDQGGEICFDTNLISEQLKGRTVEEGFIRLAALAFHEHVHHFQNPSTNLQKNEDEAYHVSDYVLLTAKTVQMPSLKWSVQSDTPTEPSIDDSYLTELPQGSKIRMPVSAFVPTQSTIVQLGKISYNRYNQETELSCYLSFPSSGKNRTLNATLELEVEIINLRAGRNAQYQDQTLQESCVDEGAIFGELKLNGVKRPEIRLICATSYPIATGTECPFYPAPKISDMRKLIENAGGALTLSSPVSF